MRKSIKLLLALVVVLVATGATGIGKVLAGSSGTPVQLSSYGTVTVDTTYTATGNSAKVNVAIFSSQGPFYTEKVNVYAYYSPTLPTITLGEIVYDSTVDDIVVGCPTVMSHNPAPYQASAFGDIMSVVPSQMVDQTGAHAVPAQGELLLELSGQPCYTATYPSGLHMFIEATVLAPTTATVCVVASETYPVPTCLPT